VAGENSTISGAFSLGWFQKHSMTDHISKDRQSWLARLPARAREKSTGILKESEELKRQEALQAVSA
jgi:hypothetical protein